MEDLLQRVVRLGAPSQGFGETGRADRHDHELLEVDAVVGVHATVEHVHHRHGQYVGIRPAHVAIQRKFELGRCRLGDRQARAEDGIGAEAGLVVGAVEVAEFDVDHSLLERVEAAHRSGNLAVDVADSRAHALAEIPRPAVAKFDRFVFAGRCARWHGRASDCAALQLDFDFDRGVAARVEDLTADDADDFTHIRRG